MHGFIHSSIVYKGFLVCIVRDRVKVLFLLKVAGGQYGVFNLEMPV